MTSAFQNPSLTRNPGSACRRRCDPLAAGGNLQGQGAPGSRAGWTGAGGKLAAEHAAQRGSEALAISTAIAAPSLGATFLPC